MDRTAVRPRATAVAQAILDPRVWGVHPLGRETTGAIQATFAVARPVATVTLWVQTSAGLDVLTYRHFRAEDGPVRSWDVTFPDLPRGAYDVIVDVPGPEHGGRRSWTARVEV
jgi:hypothetical protein